MLTGNEKIIEQYVKNIIIHNNNNKNKVNNMLKK